jgi:ABC-2 type transport system ATP-binding protein
VWQFLRQLRDAGVSIVMTTHLLDEAASLADHVVVIDRGRVVGAGTVAELTSSAPVLRFRARGGLPIATLASALPDGFEASEPAPGQYRVEGPISPDTVAAVTAWCAAAGEMPTELTTTGSTLTEAYFALTSPPEEHV